MPQGDYSPSGSSCLDGVKDTITYQVVAAAEAGAQLTSIQPGGCAAAMEPLQCARGALDKMLIPFRSITGCVFDNPVYNKMVAKCAQPVIKMAISDAFDAVLATFNYLVRTTPRHTLSPMTLLEGLRGTEIRSGLPRTHCHGRRCARRAEARAGQSRRRAQTPPPVSTRPKGSVHARPRRPSATPPVARTVAAPERSQAAWWPGLS